MKKVLVFVCLCASAVLAADVPTTEPVVARVNGAPITMSQLDKPLIEGYGLNMLLALVRLELARQGAEKQHVTVSPADVQLERAHTIENMFKESNAALQEKIDKAVEAKNTAEAERLRKQMHDDNERGFQQFLDNQHKSEAEFNILIETNAILRKIAEPMLKDKITDENLKEAFGALYGETAECRHIQCATLQEIQQAKQRLKDGESFEKVAREMSRNEATRAMGGKLPPFSRQMQGLPQAFKDAAFALKPGEVSDIVQAEGAFHLILLEKKNPPKVVKFEDVKESLRTELYDRAVAATMKQLRDQIDNQTLKTLVVEEPVLKAQLEKRLQQRNNEIKDRDEIRKQLDEEREKTKLVNPPHAENR